MSATQEAAKLKFNTARQEKLWAVIQAMEAEYKRRDQQYYLINGMSTSHIVCHAIAEPDAIDIFWPKEMIERVGNRTTYALGDKCIQKMQNAVRDTIKQLAGFGYIETMGNEHERRWRTSKKFRTA